MDENTAAYETIKQDVKLNQYLTFLLGNDIYGIKVNIIREVDRYGKVFPVPKAPECVKGIINLRGIVIPVIDLNTRLFNTESIVTRWTNIVILEIEQESETVPIGVIIDSVREVVDIPEDNIESAPGFGLNLRKDFVRGIGKVDDSFIILLDIQSVLNIDEISQIFDTGNRKNDTALIMPTDCYSNETGRNGE